MSTRRTDRLLRIVIAALIASATVAPAIATAHVAETVRDEFNAAAFDNNDGTQLWASDWREEPFGDGPLLGLLQITNDAGCVGNCLRIGGTDPNPWEPSLDRTAPLDRSPSGLEQSVLGRLVSGQRFAYLLESDSRQPLAFHAKGRIP